jgi:hypothetical protein
MNAIMSQEKILELDWEGPDSEPLNMKNICAVFQMIARAQARHLMEVLEGTCPHTTWPDSRRLCDICWKAIHDEVFKEGE